MCICLIRSNIHYHLIPLASDKTDIFKYRFYPRTITDQNCLSPEISNCAKTETFIGKIENIFLVLLLGNMWSASKCQSVDTLVNLSTNCCSYICLRVECCILLNNGMMYNLLLELLTYYSAICVHHLPTYLG